MNVENVDRRPSRKHRLPKFLARPATLGFTATSLVISPIFIGCASESQTSPQPTVPPALATAESIYAKAAQNATATAVKLNADATVTAVVAKALEDPILAEAWERQKTDNLWIGGIIGFLVGSLLFPVVIVSAKKK